MTFKTIASENKELNANPFRTYTTDIDSVVWKFLDLWMDAIAQQNLVH